MKILTKKDIKELKKVLDFLIIDLEANAYASEEGLKRERKLYKEAKPELYLAMLEGEQERNSREFRKSANNLKMVRDLF